MKTEILENTFDTIRPKGPEFAKSFYQNLFIKYPAVEPLFKNVAIEEQEKKLLLSLVLVIDNLRNLAYLKSMLYNLGERHVGYDVISDHYPLVGEVLLATLEQYLGSKWTPEAKEAWTEAYGAIVSLMLEGAKNKHPPLRFYSIELNSNVMERLRIEALARKYIRKSNSMDKIIQKLMEDTYFQEIKQKVGGETTLQIVSNIVKKINRTSNNRQN